MPLRAVAAARLVRGLGYSLYAVASLRWAHGFEIQTVTSTSSTIWTSWVAASPTRMNIFPEFSNVPLPPRAVP